LVRPFPAPVVTGTVAVPLSIDHTGATEVSAALNNFIATVPDGSIISFPTNAIYKIHMSLFIQDRNNIIFEGNGTTLQVDATADGTSAFTSPFAMGYTPGHPNTDIVIHDFILIGNSPTPGIFITGSEGQSNIHASRTTRLEIYNVTGSASHADFVDASDDNGLWVHDCHVITAGRNCFSAEKSDSDILVENCAFDVSGFITFDIEPLDRSSVCSNIIFRNCTAETYGHYFFAVLNGLGSTIDKIVVDGNTVTGGSLKTLANQNGAVRMTRIAFTNNKGGRAAAGSVLQFAHVDGLTITGNVQPLSSGALKSIADCTGAP